MAAAIEKAGGQEDLRRRLEREGFRYSNAKSVSDWKTKGNAPGVVLFAIAATLNISLDEFALQDGRSLEDRLFEIHQILSVHGHAIDDLREVRGIGPMEFPSIDERP